MTESGTEQYPPDEIGERSSKLDRSECPDCGSAFGYWQRGAVADFDYVCKECYGIFDGTTTERQGNKISHPERTARHCWECDDRTVHEIRDDFYYCLVCGNVHAIGPESEHDE